MVDILDGGVLLRGGVTAGAAMYLVRYARHGCSFPQQGIAGCVVSLMVDSGCRRKRGGFPNNEVNKHRATCTDQMRKRAHDLCGLKDQASDTISGS